MNDQKPLDNNKPLYDKQKNIALVLSALTVVLLVIVVIKMRSANLVAVDPDYPWKEQYEQLHKKYLEDMERGEREIGALYKHIEDNSGSADEKEMELKVLRQREGELQATVDQYRTTIQGMKDYFKKKQWDEKNTNGEVAYVVPARAPATNDSELLNSSDTTLYRVQRGDTMIRISVKLYGTTRYWKDIYDLNKDRIPSADSIREGTELIVPKPETLKDKVDVKKS